jgi:hypothetical protein
MSETAVAVRQEEQTAPARESANIYSMVERIMLDKDTPVERAMQALEFYQKVEAERARRAFLEAKAAFKANAPEITRDKKNKQFDSSYASIGNVVNTVNEALAKYDLDASWDYDQGDRIKVTCILRHALGHSERVSLAALPDGSGSKNPLQQIKSTLTYLRLATFEAVTGIATKEGAADDDGNAAGGSGGPITAEQGDELRKLMDDFDSDQIAGFCKYFKVGSIDDLPASAFERAKAAIAKSKAKRAS